MSDYERDIIDELEDELEEDSTPGTRRGRSVKKKGKGMAVLCAGALLAAFICFVVMTVIQDRIVNDKATTPVVVAIADVPAGVKLTEGNMALYFAIENRDAEQVPMGITYPNATPLIGEITGRAIYTNEIVTSDCFRKETVFDDIEDAVELSLELGSLGQTVSGTLRPGDLVDIVAVIKIQKNEDKSIVDLEPGIMDIPVPEGEDPLFTIDTTEGGENEEPVEEQLPTLDENSNMIVIGTDGNVENDIDEEFDLSYGVTGEYVAQVVAENIRVTGVFTSGGAQDGTEGAMVATVINISVPRQYVNAILIALEEGKITLVKVNEELELTLQETESNETVPTLTPTPTDAITVQ